MLLMGICQFLQCHDFQIVIREIIEGTSTSLSLLIIFISLEHCIIMAPKDPVSTPVFPGAEVKF